MRPPRDLREEWEKPEPEPLSVVTACVAVEVLDETPLFEAAREAPHALRHLPELDRRAERPRLALVRTVAEAALGSLVECGVVTVRETRVRSRRRRRAEGQGPLVDVWLEVVVFVDEPERLNDRANELRSEEEKARRRRREPSASSDVFALVRSAVHARLRGLQEASAIRCTACQLSGGTASPRSSIQREREERRIWRGLEYRPDGEALDRRLHEEAQRGNPTRVRWLLSLGADARGRAAGGKTPLMVACDAANWAAAEEIVRWRRGAATDALGKRPYAFWRTIEHGHEEFAAFLVDAGAGDEGRRPRFRAVHLAARRGFYRLMAIMIAQWSSEYKGALLELRTEDGSTPLHFAAEAGHVATVAWLLAQGVAPDPRRTGENGATPLDLARQADHPEVGELLSRALKDRS